MKQDDEKMQILAAGLNSGEGEILGSMLLGVCAAMRKSLGNLSAYQDMLEDEFDGNQSAMAYLEEGRANLERLNKMLKVADVVLEANKGGERIHLIKLLEGVLDRFHKNVAPEYQLLLNADDSLFVRCHTFQIQQLLFEILNVFALNRDQNEKPWNVFSRGVVLEKNELGVLNLTNNGNKNYVMIKMSVEENDLPLPGNYMLLQDCIASGMDLGVDNQIMIEWLGMAELNECHFLVRSENPRDGITILFPEVSAWEQGSDPLTYFGAPKIQEPKTILLVDDEDMIWDVISEMLQDLGYNVVLAGNGREAVQIYGGNIGKIDLVILDMLMPDMGGKEAFYILKGLDPNVKVLISSGYVSEDQIQDVMNDGAAGFLRKPYKMADLAKKIRSILG